MANVEINSEQAWKEIPVDTSLFDKEVFEGFCGIEELTDYEIVRKPKIPVSKIPGPEKHQNRKRKYEEYVQGDPKILEYQEIPAKKKPRSEKHAQEKVERKFAKEIKTPKVQDGKKQKPAKSQPKLKKSYDKYNITPTSMDTQEDNTEVLEETIHGWKDLYVPEPVIRALSDLGFTTPTSIQALTLPSAIRDGMDIVGAAETGSGKTLAFGIPIIHNILWDKEAEAREAKEEDGEESHESSAEGTKGRNTKLRCLMMTPTRELAIQIKDHLVAVTKYTDIKIAVIVGGLAPQKQYRILKQKPDIVIGTPGRLWELIQEGEPHLTLVKTIKYLVIDEADRMLEKGHFEELLQILGRINGDEDSKSTHQTFVFSATLTLIHALPQRVIVKQKKKRRSHSKQLTKLEKLLLSIGVKEKRKIVDITRQIGTAEALMEARINCSLNDKDIYLYYFLTHYPGRTLVFCNSIDCVRRLNSIFSLLQRKPWPLHAQMHQKQRLKNLERFTASETGLLLATDVAARGLDIPNVEHVIHYQVPRITEAYIHRSGRTARATKEGLSIMLIEPNEVQLYHKICKTLNRDKDLPAFPVEPAALRQAKLLVGLARKLDSQEHRSRKHRSQNNWFEKAAEDMDIEIDKEEHLKDMGEEYDQAANRRETKQLQVQLNRLLKAPISLPQSLSIRYPTYGNNMNAILEKIPVPEKAVSVMKKRQLHDKLLTGSSQYTLASTKSKSKKKYRKRH